MLLEAKNVSKAFGSFRAVAGADLSVEEGDMPVTTGEIVFDGHDLTRASPEAHARAGIGRTFQVPATFEDMTVLDNVKVGAFLRHPHHNDAREQARGILELTGLKHLANA